MDRALPTAVSDGTKPWNCSANLPQRFGLAGNRVNGRPHEEGGHIPRHVSRTLRSIVCSELGSPLMASSLCLGQGKRMLREPEIEIGNPGTLPHSVIRMRTQ